MLNNQDLKEIFTSLRSRREAADSQSYERVWADLREVMDNMGYRYRLLTMPEEQFEKLFTEEEAIAEYKQ